METRASYLAVGSFVLLLLAVLAGFVAWIGKLSFDEAVERYQIYFEGAVTGLQEGSAVRVRGIRVGEVTDIRFDPDNVARVQVTIEVQEGTPIRADSVAQLDIQGITGVPFVQITGGSQGAAPLAATGDEAYPVIPSRPSTIQAVLDTAPEILARTSRLLDELSGFVDEGNQRAVGEILANVASITGVMAQQAARLDRLVENADGLVTELRADAARLTDQAGEAIADAQQMANAYAAVADELDDVLKTARPSLMAFADTGLTEFTLMVGELRELARTLSRVSERIERDPTRFLFGTSNQGIPVQ